ncbi:uncharacterized protein EDB93DRAFT_1108857 [Suillus bovinus]|uniref:uncharacterized protein n=1 Tax=Suillus bovinus TaxID=48563 RepID=UPI001B86384B|nr:uncharacterized protein EDB93DRAFT_1108857 [Suillus bovinus]KAG2128932.1 hypothetical protein EDB93DRAFT_1108857 [Suillus bovinus]
MECQTKSGSERILQQNGLYRTFNFFWLLPHSDPYLVISYNKLHADDLGKFGKHLWQLLLTILEDLDVKGQLTINMRGVDRWSSLKHFLNVTTIEYVDGMAYFDILRMKCITEDHIEQLQGYIKTYMDYCLSSAFKNIRQKETLNKSKTCVGEGFHQEVQEAYKQTNYKDTEPQMARIDENLEAVTCIHMLIDDASQHESTLAKTTGSNKVQSSSNATQICGTLARSNEHWILGSPAAGITDAKGLADELVAHGFVNEAMEFQNTLFNFLRKNISPDYVKDSHLHVLTAFHKV